MGYKGIFHTRREISVRRYNLAVLLLAMLLLIAGGGLWLSGIRSAADLRAALPIGGPGIGGTGTQVPVAAERPLARPAPPPAPRPDSVQVQAAVEPAPVLALPQGVVAMPPAAPETPSAQPPSPAATGIEDVALGAIADADRLAEEQARVIAMRAAAADAAQARADLRGTLGPLLTPEGFDASRLRAMIDESHLSDSQKQRLVSLIEAAAQNPQDRAALLRLIDEALA